MTYYFLLLAIFFSNPSFAQNQNATGGLTNAYSPYTFELEVHFYSGKYQLSDEEYFEFSALVREQYNFFSQQLRASGADENTIIVAKQVFIKSRTDAKGSETTNMVISENRAQGLVSVVEQAFFNQDITYDPAHITAIGVGESEADEEACKYVQFVCSQEKIKFLDETFPSENKSWALLAYNFLANIILPSSHAQQRRTLLDLLFGTRRQNNSPPEYYQPPAPVEAEQCEQVVWDEACLDAQRSTTVEIVFEAVQKNVNNTVETVPLTPTQPVPKLNLYGNPL